jgi:hypothetical protein
MIVHGFQAGSPVVTNAGCCPCAAHPLPFVAPDPVMLARVVGGMETGLGRPSRRRQSGRVEAGFAIASSQEATSLRPVERGCHKPSS